MGAANGEQQMTRKLPFSAVDHSLAAKYLEKAVRFKSERCMGRTRADERCRAPANDLACIIYVGGSARVSGRGQLRRGAVYP